MEMNEYLDLFIEESKEHLQSINTQLLELEKQPSNLEIVNEIFRSAHTIKGMSATMGFEDLANLTHKMENVLDGVRNELITIDERVMDVLFNAIDDLETMVMSIASGGDGKLDVSKIVNELLKIEKGESSEQKVEAVEERNITLDSYTLTILNQAKEQNMNAYSIQVSLREDCILKRARVFMIFEVLEQAGEVIHTSPTSEELEEEKFHTDFTVTYLTAENKEEISSKILKVSEVDRVVIEDFQYVAPESIAKEIPSPTKGVSDNEVKDVQSNETPVKNQVAATKTIRVNIDRLDVLMNLFEELVIDRGRLEQIAKDLSHVELKETVERMTRVSSDLQGIILNMRMIPIETVFNRFPRMVRQLAKDLDKKIELKIVGAETELDRTVIDEIGDPLVHLIRNSLDHGIEKPEVRRKNGKSETGTVELKAYHSGNHVFIEINDDGAGISKERVLKKAIDKGIVSKNLVETMSDQEIYELIFASGFSTAEQISDISGRGVGLDVVNTTIQSLGGNVTIYSEEGKGTTFLIQLPLTLSIISVLLVELRTEKYAIPLSSIIETAIIQKKDIMTVHGQRVIDFRGKIVPLLALEEVFKCEPLKEETGTYPVVIVRKGERVLGIMVDSFIGQQEVVLKSLGNYLDNVFAVSGATILGDGQVSLIIDCNALIK